MQTPQVEAAPLPSVVGPVQAWRTRLTALQIAGQTRTARQKKTQRWLEPALRLQAFILHFVKREVFNLFIQEKAKQEARVRGYFKSQTLQGRIHRAFQTGKLATRHTRQAQATGGSQSLFEDNELSQEGSLPKSKGTVRTLPWGEATSCRQTYSLKGGVLVAAFQR